MTLPSRPRPISLSTSRVAGLRLAITDAERAPGTGQRTALSAIAQELSGEAASSNDAPKLRVLVAALNDLAGVSR